MFLKIPKKVEYGLISLVHIGSCDPRTPVSRAQIAEANRVPVELLGKVLQSMNRAGLIESVQGVHGGYRLTRPLHEVTIGQVVEAIDGPLHLVPCTDGQSVCEQAEGCRIQSPMAQIEENLRHYFFELSLGEFADQLAKARCECSEEVAS